MYTNNVTQSDGKRRGERMSAEQLRVGYDAEIQRCTVAIADLGQSDPEAVRILTRQMLAARRLRLAITPAKQQELEL